MLARPDDEICAQAQKLVAQQWLTVGRVERICEDVITISLAADPGTILPSADPGAHIDIHLPCGLVRQYSLIHATAQRYDIAVQRVAASRGGSLWLHDNLRQGMRLLIGPPRNNFALEAAPSYLFIAGGIGITPILSMVRTAAAKGTPYRLIFCTRRADRTPFREELSGAPYSENVSFCHDDGVPARGLDVAQCLASPQQGARLYCCGPNGLMSAVREAALAAGWMPDRLHFESFKAQPHHTADGSFTVVVASSGEELAVPEGRSILEVLRDAGYVVDSACEDGVCGTCQVGVLEGLPDHRDSVLSNAQREAGNIIQVCCSRAASSRLVLDL